MPRGPDRAGWCWVALIAWAAGAPGALASTPSAGGDDPAGRVLQLLQDRETALDNQTAQAARTARVRGRMLYRLMLHEAAERRGGSPPSGPGREAAEGTPGLAAPGGRAISLGGAVLERDLREVEVLRGELGRVREERQSAVTPDASGEATVAPAKMRPPVAGPVTSSYGVVKDEATGAWLFRTAAGFSAKPGSAVVAPADGRVARVAEDAGGGMAVVLAHAGGWTTVLAGLGAVAVGPRDVVRGGGVVGTTSAEAGVPLRVEVWRSRVPVDPASVFGPPAAAKTPVALHAARGKAR